MADTKISALTASTVPLAGTEVLPIVQSGVTKKVAVSDLTAGRAISATQLTLTTGNLIVASGQGIDFSATPGTGTSELLADYEEGTWTPAFSTTGVGFPAITYSFQLGKYTKIGNMVIAQFVITVGTITTVGATGAATIIGAPFTVSLASGMTLFQNNWLIKGPDIAQFSGVGTVFLLRYKTATSFGNIDPANFQAGTEVHGSITYFV